MCCTYSTSPLTFEMQNFRLPCRRCSSLLTRTTISRGVTSSKKLIAVPTTPLSQTRPLHCWTQFKNSLLKRPVSGKRGHLLPLLSHRLNTVTVLGRQWRLCSSSTSSLSEGDLRRRVDEITSLFFEARELLDDARSSANTVYFNEDMQEAQCAVEEALREYYGLLSELSVEQTQTVVAAIGLKMEELKAQLVAIREELDSS